jgi:hypothetical protein
MGSRQSLWSSDLARLGGVLRITDSALEDFGYPGFPGNDSVVVGHGGRSVALRVGPYGRIGLFFGPESPAGVSGLVLGSGRLRVERIPDLGDSSLSVSGRDPSVVDLTLAVEPGESAQWWAFGPRDGSRNDRLPVEMVWLQLDQ